MIKNLFQTRKKVPIIFQSEAAECGLICVAMIANSYGDQSDIISLRRDYAISLKGATLGSLAKTAKKMGLASRALRLELEKLNHLRLPCILHWEFNHFVVLTKITARGVFINDPAVGERFINYKIFSESFTGVALELWPSEEFKKKPPSQVIGIKRLVGKITGLRRSIAQILLFALCLEIIAICNPFFIQLVIDNALPSSDGTLLTTLALGFGLLIIMQNLISAMRSWAILYVGTSINVQWRSNVFEHLLSLPIQFFEKRHLGDISSKFGSIDQIQRTLTTSFIEALLDGLMTLLTVFMMLAYSYKLTLIVLAAMFFYVLVKFFFYFSLKNFSEEFAIHAAKQQSYFLESIRGAKTIKLFQRRESRKATWLVHLVDQINSEFSIEKIHIKNKTFNGLIFGVAGICVVWLGGQSVLQGDFSIGILVAFISYQIIFVQRVISLTDKIAELKLLKVPLYRLADIILSDAEPSENNYDIDSKNLSPELEIKNLSFRYSESEPMVLKNISLKILPGEFVALTGASGCGKSTLLSALLGIITPQSGDILIDGVSVERIGIEGIRSLIGTVLQDDVLFAGSIAENISFFDPLADNALIAECAHQASVLDDIKTMPMGFNSLVGDMGTILSGGQKQRILLARALYKKPKFLLLDEATSHLDVTKESEVNKAIAELRITRFIIAHRPQTINSADRIIVMRDGEIIQG